MLLCSNIKALRLRGRWSKYMLGVKGPSGCMTPAISVLYAAILGSCADCLLADFEARD